MASTPRCGEGNKKHMARVAINGFGRIGRLALRAILERVPDIDPVAVNDLASAETNAHLFKYDSNYGTLQR